MFSINKSLLPIKAHFFLYSGMEVMRKMSPLMYREKGVPSEAVGMVFSIITIVGLFITLLGGIVADYFKVHRMLLIILLVVATIGTNAIYFLPNIPTATPMSLNTVGHVEKSHLSNMELEGQGILESSEMKPDSSVLTESKMGITDLLMTPEFLFLVICHSTDQGTTGLVATMTDTIAFKVLDGETTKYGQQKMFSEIGQMTNAAIAGFLIDWYSEGLPQRDSLPAFVICLGVMVLAISNMCKIKLPETPKVVKTEENKPKNISALLNFKTVLFLLLVVVVGFAMNLMWVFKCLLAEDIIDVYDPSFGSHKLLQGLMISMQGLSGAVIYGSSGLILRRFGHTSAFILALCCLGLHFTLYYFISNPWLILPLELLYGPSFGLYRATSASYAAKIAPPGATARLQAIAQAAFFTGFIIAGFLGGCLYNSYGGYLTFLLMGCFVFGFSLFYALCKLILKLKDRLDSKDLQVTKDAGLESEQPVVDIYPTPPASPKAGHLTSLDDSFFGDFMEISYTPSSKDCPKASRKFSMNSYDSGFQNEVIESVCNDTLKSSATPRRSAAVSPHGNVVLDVDVSPIILSRSPKSSRITILESVKKALNLSNKDFKSSPAGSKRRLPLWEPSKDN
ncbi:unnamed protein product [Meganyctiphanes norvegica]|uniref:Major facilitator superfamily (MFS) profile domain-containing protein n=1 Tax=Meganyctiphanes norvegica TaxID=48144 RepID=A0AAV2Q7M8_MEGNR